MDEATRELAARKSNEIFGRAVSADDVQEAYRKANTKWHPPSLGDCDVIAGFLTSHRFQNATFKAIEAISSKSAKGPRRLEQHNAIRGAVGVLLKELPDMAEWAQLEMPGSAQANALAALLAAAKGVAGYWPSLNGSARKSDKRSEWHLTANGIVGPILTAWRRANPSERVAEPGREGQPATSLMVAILALAGHSITEEALVKHFKRDKAGFVLLRARQPEGRPDNSF